MDTCWLVIVGICGITAHFTMTQAIKNVDISYFRLLILIIIGIILYEEEFKLVYLIGGTLIFIGN